MGKKRWLPSRKVLFCLAVLISSLAFYQNCSEVNLIKENGSHDLPPPGRDQGQDASDTKPDAYTYTDTEASSRPGGGTEPTDWQVEGAQWFDNFIYGNPGFSECTYFNMATQKTETTGFTVITGEEKDIETKKGIQHVKTLFELRDQLLDMRYGELGGGGLTAFRIFVPADVSISKVSLDMHVCCAANLMPEGMVVTISRKLCDFREKNVSEKIYTQEYCTIGNTINAGMDIIFNFEVMPTPSGARPCSLEPGYYYYVNILGGHAEMNGTSYLNGVLSIRPTN